MEKDNDEMNIDNKQLSFLPVLEENECKLDAEDSITRGNSSLISEKLWCELDYYSIPFIGCDYDKVYPKLSEIIPKETCRFDSWGLNVLIMAEVFCAGICHQMNWDYLRTSLWEKLERDKNWVLPEKLVCIEEKEVLDFFDKYDKPERIRAKERTQILREIGKWALSFNSVGSIFFDEKGCLLSQDQVRNNLLICSAFASDVEEKKLQLLLQKLSAYTPFKGMEMYCQPAIDYHLIRTYLRRGLLYAKTEYAKRFIEFPDVSRKEQTVAAFRHLCAELMKSICWYSGLSVSIVNQIDWHIGRSVCLQESPDCNLEQAESQWLRPFFDTCPFSNTCAAKCGREELLNLKEPTYKGSSY